MNASAEHRSILRAFAALVVILASAAGLLLITEYLLFTAELRASQRISEFHLRTLVLLGESKAKIVKTQHDLQLDDRALEPEIDIVPVVLSIGQVLASVEELQDEFEGEAFRQTLLRARSQYERILAIEPSIRARSGYERELASLAFTVHQLERLHALTVDEILADSSSVGAGTQRALATGVAALIILTMVVVTRLFFLVRGRLKELSATEIALRESQALLMQAQKFEALGTLAGGVAHDFNNVLTTILCRTESLLEEFDSEAPVVRELRQIQEAGERAAGVTRQLLLFSSQQPSERQPVDIGLLVRDIAPLLRRLLRADIELELDLGEHMGPVLADPVQVEQVLMNLTVNARDAMPDGGRLTIRGRTRSILAEEAEALGLVPGHYTEIATTDSGDGMSAQVRERIFEPFFTTKEIGKGTGLGLSTVHGIVTQNNGQVRVLSEPGQGATFEVLLPRCDQTQELRTDPIEAKPRGRGEAILLIEDDGAVRLLMESALSTGGYEVFAAGGADEATRLCRERKDSFDLILTDVVMPGIRGPALVKQLHDISPGSAVVYVSGYFEEEILESVVASGHPFLPKPFRLQKLLEVVREALDARLGSELLEAES